MNPTVDGDGHCANGNPGVNCNQYDGKQFVWLSGAPLASSLADGQYMFAVLVPGGQGGHYDPNDGTPSNLSDLSPTTGTGAGDAWTNRVFSISAGTLSYSGTHDFANNLIRLMPYDDTTNPGGVYILAVCNLADRDTGAANQPGVNPSDCKYDAFKVLKGTTEADSPVTVKDAAGSNNRTFTWTIAKAVDNTLIQQSATGATANYTVTVTHSAGTVSAVKVTGNVTVFNPNTASMTATVTDQLSDGTVCTVTGGANATLVSGDNVFPYECDLSNLPQGELDNTATTTWGDQTLSDGPLAAGTDSFTFSNITFTENQIDECAAVTDTYGGNLGTVCVGDANPTIYKYSRPLTGTPGTCTSFDNTATFTTNDTGTTGSDSQTVKLCVGSDLTVSKDAAPTYTRTYNWQISKDVDKTVVKTNQSSATFNYTVKAGETGFTDGSWQVAGSIKVTNPNDWEAIQLTGVKDVIDNGGDCTITSGDPAATLAANGSATLGYTCTYASAPNPAAFTNTATATWDASAAYTPDGTASGTATGSFGAPTTTVHKTVTITDTYAGTLGTLTATDATPFASGSYPYSRTVTVPSTGCATFDNTATIVETGQTASQSVKVCGPAKTGALTMGFWQNKNGQAIITGAYQPSLSAYLNGYAPFADLGTKTVSTYVNNVVNAANASGASMNAMLKAQMLATALDVYFSDPALGGNKINAPAPIGGVAIDLTQVCSNPLSCSSYVNTSSAFGGSSHLTVSQLLSYAASQSNTGGSAWYGQVKSVQELAKDTFDAINNQKAFAW